MKDIINFNAIVKYLERQNLKIDNKTKLKKYIEDNNFNVINAFHIEDRCLFKLNPNFIKQNIFSNLKMVNPPIDFDRIIHLLVKYCETNDNTKVYKIKNTKDVFLTWSELPLDIMCLT